ncbi:MAG: hypothetical protein U5R48_13285 [Gammaproteobacteria bacterium]|nr:hypothetical protein [Gammaproteobacteria bacterium]
MSDLTGDGAPDTTYVHAHEYYGYFDPQKCYSYDSTRQSLRPEGGLCGSLLLPGVAGRMERQLPELGFDGADRYGPQDALRRRPAAPIPAALTVLERTLSFPPMATAWAKYYNGSDIHRLTPFSGLTTGLDTQESGITFCNTTEQPAPLKIGTRRTWIHAVMPRR